MRKPAVILGVVGSLSLALSARGAVADELPVRKAGLWEMKLVKAGAPVSSMTMQHCTDEATDKILNDSVSPLGKQMCSKQEVKKTATGYSIDAVCGAPSAVVSSPSSASFSVTSHTEIVGDFNSAYTVNSTSHSDKGPGGKPLDTVTKIEAKWLGACKPDQKPGDIVLPGGLKMNVKDMEKLKALLPGAKQ